MSNPQHNQQLPALPAAHRSIGSAIEAYGRASQQARNLFFLVSMAVLLGFAAYFLVLSVAVDRRLAANDAAVSSDAERLMRYNQQLTALEGRMAGYLADSVESQLRRMDQRLSSGNVGPDEIKEFEALKNQIQLLQSYTVGKAGNLTDPSSHDHPRLQQSASSLPYGVGGGFLDDMTTLKYLAYLGFASCSVVALLVGGYWWRQEYQLRRLVAMSANIPLLPSPHASDE